MISNWNTPYGSSKICIPTLSEAATIGIANIEGIHKVSKSWFSNYWLGYSRGIFGWVADITMAKLMVEHHYSLAFAVKIAATPNTFEVVWPVMFWFYDLAFYAPLLVESCPFTIAPSIVAPPASALDLSIPQLNLGLVTDTNIESPLNAHRDRHCTQFNLNWADRAARYEWRAWQRGYLHADPDSSLKFRSRMSRELEQLRNEVLNGPMSRKYHPLAQH